MPQPQHKDYAVKCKCPAGLTPRAAGKRQCSSQRNFRAKSELFSSNPTDFTHYTKHVPAQHTLQVCCPQVQQQNWSMLNNNNKILMLPAKGQYHRQGDKCQVFLQRQFCPSQHPARQAFQHDHTLQIADFGTPEADKTLCSQEASHLPLCVLPVRAGMDGKRRSDSIPGSSPAC